MIPALRFRVIGERNLTLSMDMSFFAWNMEMSFFISYPISNALPGPDKSGHRPPRCIIVRSALHACPDLRGTLMPPVKGNEIKKDISILFYISSFSGDCFASFLWKSQSLMISLPASGYEVCSTINIRGFFGNQFNVRENLYESLYVFDW